MTAMARIRKSIEEKDDKGFTLIELLVVMIIIGILAAIAIPLFLNQRKKAEDSAAKADVSTLGKEIATYYVDGTGALTVAGGNGTDWTLTPAGGGAAVQVGPSSKNVTLVAASTAVNSRDDWCVTVTNAQGSLQTFSYGESEGLQAAAACP